MNPKFLFPILAGVISRIVIANAINPESECAFSGEDLLVCHDNKPKDDAREGYLLPRLGVIAAGNYANVVISSNDPLAQSKDLESLTRLDGNERFLVCESSGKCFDTNVSRNNTGTYVAETKRVVQLPVPAKPKFYNIESVSFGVTGDPNIGDICYDHRGGIYAGEEPWTRCATYNLLTGAVGDYKETFPEDPFANRNKLNRAISDRAVNPQTGETYFVATIDTEGSDGIEATGDAVYSIIYKAGECVAFIPDNKVEGLSISNDGKTVTFSTDNDRPGAERICRFSLERPSENPDCFNVPHGIGGLTPIHSGNTSNRCRATLSRG